MRLKIFDLMDDKDYIGNIRIDESQGFPDVIIEESTGQDKKDWNNT